MEIIKEIEDGVGDTGIRPGIIKVATGPGEVTAYEEQVLVAAARASEGAQRPPGARWLTHARSPHARLRKLGSPLVQEGLISPRMHPW